MCQLHNHKSWTQEGVWGRYKAENVVRVNGIELHYAAEGEGYPVVLVHSDGADHGSYIAGSKIMGNLLLRFFG